LVGERHARMPSMPIASDLVKCISVLSETLVSIPSRYCRRFKLYSNVSIYNGPIR
jgi:hypothetical protein